MFKKLTPKMAGIAAALLLGVGLASAKSAPKHLQVLPLPGGGPDREVAQNWTKLTPADALVALREGWSTVFGYPPTAQALTMLKAQWAHETANGTKMLNYNFGGLKGRSPEGATVQAMTSEGEGENARRVSQYFRAYSTAAAGAADFIHLLGRKYPDAIMAARAGQPEAYVAALRAGGYFTGSPSQYLSNLKRYFTS